MPLDKKTLLECGERGKREVWAEEIQPDHRFDSEH